MTGRRFARLSAASLTAVLLVGVIAAPAAATNPTRWVDDNAGGNGGPAACATAAFTTIQAAINASNSWDRVNVCPGTYAEQLTLDVKGIQVRSVPGHSAHLVAPSAMTPTDGFVSLVRMTAWAARLVGFDIAIAAGAQAIVPTGSPTCSHVDVAVMVTGQRTRVRHNVIDATGLYTLSGECGYDYGIVVGQHGPTGGLLAPPYDLLSAGRVARNTVRDFKVGGILIEGSDYIVRVDHNTVTAAHADDPGCTPTFAPCFPAVRPSVSINGAFTSAFGIGVEDGAAADVQSNTIWSASFSPGLYMLQMGVALFGADGATRVRSNSISTVGTGVTSVGSSAIPATPGVGGPEISDNGIGGVYTGISLSDNGHDVHGNTANSNIFGINVYGQLNHVHDNSFTSNLAMDCNDSGPAGSYTQGKANLWENNVALLDTPPGICVTTPI